MANRLEITTIYEGASWQVTAKVDDDSDEGFPRDIFLWTLDSDGAPDAFQAIGHIDQIARYPLYDSDRTSNFGIHLVRRDESEQNVASEEVAENVATVLKSAFQILLDGYEAAIEPVIEYYP